MSKIIEFKEISKDFKISVKKKGNKKSFLNLFRREKKVIKALSNVSFEIEQGDIVGYIGPNGAGKSTTIKIMSGILTPTSGECSIMGHTPWKDRKKYVKNIGVVFFNTVSFILPGEGTPRTSTRHLYHLYFRLSSPPYSKHVTAES